MKIVVDTNIIFSLMLNTNGALGELFFNSDGIFYFYSCEYMRFEISKHWEKLKRISKLSDVELEESRFKIFSKINFIHEALIPQKIWMGAEKLVNDIDIDDVDFVALRKYLNGILWTGDKQLYTGLKNKKFKSVYNTLDLAFNVVYLTTLYK